MVDTWALAEERFGAAGTPKFYTSHLGPSSPGRLSLSPLLGGSVCGRTDPPGWRVFPPLLSQATQGRKALGLGPLLLPLGQRRTGPGRLQLRRGPGRRESKAAMWAPLSSLASKRYKQTLSLCQAAAAPSSRPQPVRSLPSAPSWKASSASVPGAPHRGPDLWPRRREGNALPS